VFSLKRRKSPDIASELCSPSFSLLKQADDELHPRQTEANDELHPRKEADDEFLLQKESDIPQDEVIK
jgi:hypothetical protein